MKDSKKFKRNLLGKAEANNARCYSTWSSPRLVVLIINRTRLYTRALLRVKQEILVNIV